MRKFLRRNCGFTLIELMIVIAIIGILSTLLMANFIGARQRARDAQRKSDLKQIQTALEEYRADNGSYPSTFWVNSMQGDSWIPGASPKYMSKVLKDPTNSGGFPWDASGNYTYAYCSSGCTPWCTTVPGQSYVLTARLENTSDPAAGNTVYYAGNPSCGWSGAGLYTLTSP